MKYNEKNYIGKKIQLYPTDTYKKYGIIQRVDDLGWTIKITTSESEAYEIGKEYFISHSKEFSFKFL